MKLEVYHFNCFYNSDLKQMEQALNDLNQDEVQKIATCRLNPVGIFNENGVPKSIIIAIENDNDGRSQFTSSTKKVVLRSESIREKFWSKYHAFISTTTGQNTHEGWCLILKELCSNSSDKES